MGVEITLGVRLECLGDHDGSEVRTTDTNVDDCIDGLAGVSLPDSAAYRLGELFDVRKDTGDLVHAGLCDLPLVKVTESSMEDSTVLGGVDVLSGEHLVAIGLELCLAGEVKESTEDGLGDQVLGEIEKECDGGTIRGDILAAELGETGRILGKEILKDEI